MEMKNMIGGIVSLAVVVICVAAIMMPVLNDATETQGTLTNSGLYRMAEKELSDSDEIVIEWDYTTPTVVTVDGVEYTFSNEVLPSSSSRTFAFCDDHLLRISNYNGSNYGIELWYGTAQSVMVTDAVNLTVTIAADSLTWVKGTSTSVVLSTTGDWNVIDNDGAYVMKDPTASAHMLKTSYFQIAGISGVGESGGSPTMAFFCIDGTLDDFTITNPNGVTISNETSTYTATDGYADVYDLEKITFTTTYNDNDVDQTYTYFMVPYEVTGELSQHLGSGEIALINAIPVLVIVSLVVAAVGMLVVRNRD